MRVTRCIEDRSPSFFFVRDHSKAKQNLNPRCSSNPRLVSLNHAQRGSPRLIIPERPSKERHKSPLNSPRAQRVDGRVLRAQRSEAMKSSNSGLRLITRIVRETQSSGRSSSSSATKWSDEELEFRVATHNENSPRAQRVDGRVHRSAARWARIQNWGI